MRILLDNCVNHRFGPLISGHEVVHVRAMGWADLTNGKLIAAAELEKFSVLLTVDQNLRFQQNLANRQLSLITLDARKITLAGLMPFIPPFLGVLDDLSRNEKSGQNILISLPKGS